MFTLFFTEMWERMSYYGMRALLVLFMVDAVQKGGMGLTDARATAIYGLYTAAAYLATLPGGWIADRLIGAQKAVWIGGIIIATGHFILAIPRVETFFLGLILVVLGTGLLKPNISTLVGSLYPEGGGRRDAGFTLFYMGINIGGALGPLVCSFLGEKIEWHYGFAASGVGMVAGLIQFRWTRSHLGDAGMHPGEPASNPRTAWGVIGACLALGTMVFVLACAGVLTIDPVGLSRYTALLIATVAIGYFGWALFVADLTSTERKRVAVIAILFVAAAMFWAGFEQAGSSLNLFADRYTQRTFGSLGNVEIPAGWFQSLNSLFVILLAPIVATLWMTMASRNASPSLGTKCAWGLLLLALGFLVLAWAAKRALTHGPVWPTWLVMTYLLHTLGELLLSPVGLSAVTKLSPPRLVGQMMGTWFLGASLGNLIAGMLAGQVTGDQAAAMPERFMQVVFTAGATGLILLLAAKPIRRLMSGVS